MIDKKYEIVTVEGSNQSRLTERLMVKVNKLMGDGWEPLSGVSISRDTCVVMDRDFDSSSHTEYMMSQAMTKTEYIKPIS